MIDQVVSEASLSAFVAYCDKKLGISRVRDVLRGCVGEVVKYGDLNRLSASAIDRRLTKLGVDAPDIAVDAMAHLAQCWVPAVFLCPECGESGIEPVGGGGFRVLPPSTLCPACDRGLLTVSADAERTVQSWLTLVPARADARGRYVDRVAVPGDAVELEEARISVHADLRAVLLAEGVSLTVFLHHLLTGATQRTAGQPLECLAFVADPASFRVATAPVLQAMARAAKQGLGAKSAPRSEAGGSASAAHDVRALHAALLSAFPQHLDLKRAVFYGMEVNLDEVAGGQNLSGTVFSLVEWARSVGRLDELVAAAKRENPGNVKLRAYGAEASVDVLSQLIALLPSQFDELLLRLKASPSIFSSSSAPQTTRAVELVRFVQQRGMEDRLAVLLSRG